MNVVPVIAKSDSLTLEERQAFKERIKEEFTFHNLKMYPYDNDELDDEERVMNVQIKVCATNTTGVTMMPMILGYHPLRGRRKREEHCRQRKASTRPPEPLGCD